MFGRQKMKTQQPRNILFLKTGLIPYKKKKKSQLIGDTTSDLSNHTACPSPCSRWVFFLATFYHSLNVFDFCWNLLGILGVFSPTTKSSHYNVNLQEYLYFKSKHSSGLKGLKTLPVLLHHFFLCQWEGDWLVQGPTVGRIRNNSESHSTLNNLLTISS